MKKKCKLIIILYIILAIIFMNNSFETIDVSSTHFREVGILGINVGLKMYTNGVLVVGMSEIENKDGYRVKPFENSGIKEGDMIKEINNTPIVNTNQLIELVNNAGESELKIKYQRGMDEFFYTSIIPVKSSNDQYMLGLWVRDAAAGLGTLTYYNPETMRFAALGHGINDIDTGDLLNILNGEIITSNIISIVKGKSGRPGEIRGIIDNGINVGDIDKNTDLGVFGTIKNIEYIKEKELLKVPVANRNEIKTGKATIYCQISNEEVSQFEIEIKKIYKYNRSNNKSMFIKIKDKKLLEKTGGIIPGMSGTPIVQDGKFIGAITNVLLNDPTQGYAIFADMMME